MSIPSLLLLLLAGPALAAPLFQTQVEILRAGGMSEVPFHPPPPSLLPLQTIDESSLQKDILAHLHANHPTPAYTGSPLYRESDTSTVYDFIDRDTEGDVSPGRVPRFHYADATPMNRLLGSVRDFLGCRENADMGPGTEEGRPAWRFAWMGGAWRSAASRAPRLR
jgi:hypothetical protein